MLDKIRFIRASLCLVLLFSFSVSAAVITIDAGGKTTTVESSPLTVTISKTGEAVFVSDDFGYLSKSGEPQIPWKVMTVLLPPNADMSTVSCSIVSAEYEAIDGEWDVSPSPPILTRDTDGNEIEIWPAGKSIVDGRDVDIYSTDALWPFEDVQLTGTGRLRGWRLAEITVPLVRYNPVSGELQRLVHTKISVDCDMKGKAAIRSAFSRGAATGKRRGHDRVKKLTVNFDDAVVIYEASEVSTESIQQDAPESDDGIIPLSPGGASGYVIITTNDIRANSTKLADFVAHKQSMGFTVTVIDEDDTGATEVGDAAATKLRQWLQANYVSMDIKYALIIGDPRPDNGYVPMKLFPCGERNIPTDYFYAELTCDWDSNNNGIIGESGEIERYFEVYVGRIPYYGVISDTDAILQKTIDYENSTDTDWRRHVILPMVPLDSNMESYDLGERLKANLLEPRAISSDRVYRNGYGHTVTDYNILPPPEFPASAYPATVWSHGQYGLNVWTTHGWSGGASSIISRGDTLNLNDNYPTTTFQGSCETAYPYHDNNLTYMILKNGGIVANGATRNAYYSASRNYPNSPTVHGMSYRYAKGIVEGKSCGEALWDLKEETGSWWTHNWTLFNPYGDPSVVVMGDIPAFTITPTDLFCAQRNEGAIAVLPSRTYTLKNNSGSPLNWTVSELPGWIDVSVSSGSIAAGQTTTIEVSVTNDAELLGIGTHEETLVFTDTVNGTIYERDVRLVIKPRQMVGYWKLDDVSGDVTTDSSGVGNDGVLNGISFDSSGVTGVFGGGLSFSGVDGYVSADDVCDDVASSDMSVAMWIKSGVKDTQQFFASFNTSSGSNRFLFGQQAGKDTLCVHRSDWQDSGVVVFDDVWHHVAFVLSDLADELQIFVDGEFVFSFTTEALIEADDTFSLGHEYDGSTASDFYIGELDDVRVYNYALTLVEIGVLLQGGGAENPVPYDGSVGYPTTILSWVGGSADVTGYEVYFGSSLIEVANATKSSDEYKGETQESDYHYLSDTIKFFSEYFWRVDTVTATGTITGKVWSFTTGDYRGAITRQVWTGLSGNDVSTMTGNADYPDTPDISGEISSFEGPTNWAENYGSRIHGFLVPEVSGSYTFWVAGDDNSELWLSSDEFPVTAEMIAEVPGWSNSRQWDKYAQQQSGPVELIAGKHYYIKALHKEGGGGDNIAVAWQGPDMSREVIAGSHLMPYFEGYIWTPQFDNDTIIKSYAVEGYGYSGTVAGEAEPIVGTTVTYSRVAGGRWLDIAADGTLSGVPGDMDAGLNYFTVRATDEAGAWADATLEITVFDAFTGERGLFDLAGFAGHWLDSGCVDVPACGGADLTGDGCVDIEDVTAFADMWLVDYDYRLLVSHWSFDVDGSDMAGGNDAVLVNGAHVTSVSGAAKVGSGAISFDGVDDYATANSLCASVAGRDITIAMWIKADTVSVNKFFAAFNTAVGDNRLLFGQAVSSSILSVYDNGWHHSGATVFDGTWHHAAFVLSDSTDEVIIYVDGDFVYSYTTETSISTDDLFSFGQEYDAGMATGDFFAGMLDDVRVYDIRLTEEAIKALGQP